MSTTSKKVPIDEESKNYTDSLETTSDLYRNHAQYIRDENNKFEERKKSQARNIQTIGEEMYQEIENKRKNEHIKRNKLINKINKFDDEIICDHMSYDELDLIHIELKEKNKPWYIKLIEFFMIS